MAVERKRFFCFFALGEPACGSVLASFFALMVLGCHQPPQGADLGSDHSSPPQHLVETRSSRGEPQSPASSREPSRDRGSKATDAEASQKALLSIWRSPAATLEQRADAATKGLPRGARVEAAQALLGQDARLVHYFGPSMEFARATNGEISGRATDGHDYWQLEYEGPKGTVGLRFSFDRSGPSPGLRFDRAYPMRLAGDSTQK